MEQHVVDYLIPLYRNKWRIVWLSLLIAVGNYGVSFLLPTYYEARTSILPAAKTTSPLNLNALQPVLPLLGLPQTDNQSQLFLQILRSRTVRERILARFDLQKRWGISSTEKALKRLAAQTSMTNTREGMILLAFEARDPRLAADVARAYVEELDRVNREKNTSQAHFARLYIEGQLKITEKELKEASQRLADFRLQHKAIDLPEQLKAAIEQAAQLKGQIIAKEVQLGVMQKTMKPDNPRIRELRTEIAELRRQYEQLQYGGDQPLTARREFYIPFQKAPEVGLKLADLMREVKIKEAVYELLNQQYYQAKIEEAKNTPTVQVLDEAQIPERKSRPRRLLFAVTGLLIGLVGGVGMSVWDTYRRGLQRQRPDEYARWHEFWSVVQKDFQKLLGRKSR